MSPTNSTTSARSAALPARQQKRHSTSTSYTSPSASHTRCRNHLLTTRKIRSHQVSSISFQASRAAAIWWMAVAAATAAAAAVIAAKMIQNPRRALVRRQLQPFAPPSTHEECKTIRRSSTTRLPTVSYPLRTAVWRATRRVWKAEQADTMTATRWAKMTEHTTKTVATRRTRTRDRTAETTTSTTGEIFPRPSSTTPGPTTRLLALTTMATIATSLLASLSLSRPRLTTPTFRDTWKSQTRKAAPTISTTPSSK